MKIAIISDWHLGLNWKTNLEMDSFMQLSEAFKQIKEENIDLILCAGDLFDKTLPNHEVYYEAIKLLNNVNIENKIDLKNTNNQKLKIPMIAIIGNHEFRGKDFKSTVELLEVMGFLKVLHANSIKIKHNHENINIFGLAGVPDSFAKEILNKWNPTPIENEYNILMIHQSLKEYLPFESEDMLSLSNLPNGFDLIINGHLHWNTLIDLEQGGKFLMPGSTVATQNKKIESENKKGFYILETKDNSYKFIEINNTRPMYYLDLKYNKKTIPEIKYNIIEKITEILNKEKQNKKPLIRIRIKGELQDGFFAKDLNLKQIENEFENKAYFSFSNKLVEKSLKESVEKLKTLQKDKGNIFEISKEIFFENLNQTKLNNTFDNKRLFDALYNKDLELAKKIIIEE